MTVNLFLKRNFLICYKRKVAGRFRLLRSRRVRVPENLTGRPLEALAVVGEHPRLHPQQPQRREGEPRDVEHAARAQRLLVHRVEAARLDLARALAPRRA